MLLTDSNPCPYPVLNVTKMFAKCLPSKKMLLSLR